MEVAATAGTQGASLEGLLDELEAKRRQLASMPSIWPTKGWLTSRFGRRVSPFTGRTEKHAGIDIAAKSGSSIAAPARGRVSSIGTTGPLGNSVIVDHGFGVKTFYGHTEEIHVGVGEEVTRGQLIASVGSSGRSTGPHLASLAGISEERHHGGDAIGRSPSCRVDQEQELHQIVIGR